MEIRTTLFHRPRLRTRIARYVHRHLWCATKQNMSTVVWRDVTVEAAHTRTNALCQVQCCEESMRSVSMCVAFNKARGTCYGVVVVITRACVCVCEGVVTNECLHGKSRGSGEQPTVHCRHLGRVKGPLGAHIHTYV